MHLFILYSLTFLRASAYAKYLSQVAWHSAFRFGQSFAQGLLTVVTYFAAAPIAIFISFTAADRKSVV